MASAGLDDFREQAAEPVECSVRIMVQVRPGTVWVGVYRLDGSPHAGGSHLWSRRYARPEGKTAPECVEAMVRAALLAQQGGEVVA